MTVEELNLETESGAPAEARRSRRRAGSGFGITLGPLGADMARAACSVPSGTRGVLVTDVDPASAAAREGVRPGDVILKINGQAVDDGPRRQPGAAGDPPGGAARLLLWKGGQETFVVVTKE